VKWLANLPPAQRRILMIGVPVVAVLALFGRRPSTAAGNPVVTSGVQAPNTGAIGVGELSGWLSGITDVVGGLAGRISDLEAQPLPSSTPTDNGEASVPIPASDSDTWRTAAGPGGVTGPQNTPTGFHAAPVGGVHSFVGHDGQTWSSAGWQQGRAPADTYSVTESFMDDTGQRWWRVIRP